VKTRLRQMPPRRRRLPRLLKARARPKRPRPVKRRWRKVLAGLAVLALLWLLWPSPPETPPGSALPTKLAAAGKPADLADKPGKLPDTPPDKLKQSRSGPGGPVANPKPPPPKARLRAQRDLLLAAVRSRAATLRPCVPGDAVELQVPVRLHVVRTGAVKSVDFAGEPPPRALRECVRRVATGWNFGDLTLPGDLELFATLALSPGA